MATLILAALLAPPHVMGQDRPPFTMDQLIRLVESDAFTPRRIVQYVHRSCLAFRMDDRASARLEKAGASEGLVTELGSVCTIPARSVAHVQLTPEELDVPVGGTRVLRAVALDPDSVEVEDAGLDWTSTDTMIAEVSAGGTVVGKREGKTSVTAAADDGPSAVAIVTVVPAAGTERSGKSPAMAVLLGALAPGGGELYVGRRTRGAIALGGTAIALGIGLLQSSTDTVDVTHSVLTEPDPSCGSSCAMEVTTTRRLREKRELLAASLIASGVIWAAALIDGALHAGAPERRELDDEAAADRTTSAELLPSDGVVADERGVGITVVRIRL